MTSCYCPGLVLKMSFATVERIKWLCQTKHLCCWFISVTALSPVKWRMDNWKTSLAASMKDVVTWNYSCKDTFVINTIHLWLSQIKQSWCSEWSYFRLDKCRWCLCISRGEWNWNCHTSSPSPLTVVGVVTGVMTAPHGWQRRATGSWDVCWHEYLGWR